MDKKPVIFLAFANDRIDTEAYLRNLPLELDGIRNALLPAVKAGLCEVVERSNATIQNILDVFQDEYYQNRIAIFHYGGHANGYQLLLENTDGSNASAHSEGLVSFFRKQKGLKLIFLNGCSSQNQAEDLVDAGISAVIGTSQSINDEVATTLAIRFYKGLAMGYTLEKSWLEAIDQIEITKGTANMRDLFWEGAAENTAHLINHLPWEIYYRQGAELVRTWNLPEAVDNPLFGLPELPQFDLPEQPYRFLERYRKEHAPIFFGRSYAIRELFNRATDNKSAPIILFYGQSGVGKSSMLDAGLLPRLEQVAYVIYVRRDAQLGLLGSIYQALGLKLAKQSANAKNTALDKNSAAQEQLRLLASESDDEHLKAQYQLLIEQLQKQATELADNEVTTTIEVQKNLLEVWQEIEIKHQQPLIILLDQVEEVYTKPHAEMPEELDATLAAIEQVFKDANTRPQGKLILSYRKEYHPEISEAFKKLMLPREKIFLQKIEHRDIIEIITGLSSTEQLQNAYGLKIENELPDIIADDLLEDKSSPIAPVLQILLTKMWKLSKGEDFHYFSVRKYTSLKKKGILMDDFFREQMEKALQMQPTLISSGLAIDLLHFHTTNLGTAGSRTLEDIRNRYGERQEVLVNLMNDFKNLYLLSDAGLHATVLAHDTLAPIIREEFRKSDKPGPRATFILENKKIAYEQQPDTIIDLDDLQLVETGKDGMRLWVQAEEELVEKSRRHREKRLAEKRRNKRLALLALCLIIASSLFAFYKWQEAIEQREAVYQAGETTQAHLYLMQSSELYNANPTKALDLLAKAYQLRPDDPKTQQASMKVFYGQSRYPFYQKSIKAHSGWIESISPVSTHGTFYTIGNDDSLKFWNLKGDLIASDTLNDYIYNFATSSPKGGLLAICDTRLQTVRIFDSYGKPIASLSTEEPIEQVLFPHDEQHIAIISATKVLLLNHEGILLLEIPVTEGIYGAAFSPSGKRLYISSRVSKTVGYTMDGVVVASFPGYYTAFIEEDLCLVFTDRISLTNSLGEQALTFDAQNTQSAMTRAIISPSKNHILTFDTKNSAQLWDRSGHLIGTIPNVAYGHTAVFSNNGQAILLAQMEAEKAVAKIWSTEAKVLYRFDPLLQQQSAVQQLGFSPDGEVAYVVTTEEYVQTYQLASKQLQILKGHEYSIMGLRYINNTHAITASRDSTMKFWDLTNQLQQVFKSSAFMPDLQIASNMLLVSNSNGGNVNLWNLEEKTSVFEINDSYQAAISANGKYLINLEQQLIIYNTQNRAEEITLKAIEPITGDRVAWADSSNFIYYSRLEHAISQWNISGEEAWTYPTNIPVAAEIERLYVFPDKQRLVFQARANVYITDMKGQVLHVLQHPSPLFNLDFSPDGQYIATTPDITGEKGAEEGACLWDWNGQLIRRFSHDLTVFRAVFSPDSQYVLTGGADNKAKLWKIDGTLLFEINGHNEWVKDVVFAPDQTYFATAAWDNTVRLWNMQGQEIAKLEGGGGYMGAVAIAPNLKHIVTLENPDLIRIWSPPQQASALFERLEP